MTKALFIILVLFSSHISYAAMTPLSVGIVPPAQFPPSDYTVAGARLSLLWGHHRDVYGLDLGVLGNITEQDFVGVGVSGLFNWTKGSTTILGLQAAAAANINTQKLTAVGLQIAAVNWNSAASSISGVQLGLINHSPFTNVYGLQAGIYNKAQEVYGLQIGVVNMASNLHGVQIGLINFHHKGVIGVSPILNIGF